MRKPRSLNYCAPAVKQDSPSPRRLLDDGSATTQRGLIESLMGACQLKAFLDFIEPVVLVRRGIKKGRDI
jgi:hypothetical protein